MASSIRILHVIRQFHPAFTGEGKFVERITPVMEAIAPEIEHDMLATETPRPTQSVPSVSALRRVIYLTKSPTSHWKHEILLLWWLLCNLGRYRVVHCHTHIDRHFLAYMLIKLWGRRLVLSATLDDSLPGLLLTYRKMNRPLVSRLFSLFDELVAISPKLKAESDQMAPPERVHLVPVGVGIPTTTMRRRDAMRAEHRVAIDDMVMIFIGGICDRKDPLFLVEQLPSIMRFCPRAKLFIVGPVLETNHLSRMIEAIRDHRLEGRVVFIGEVEDPDPFYEMADIMTFPSHLEGFGSVVVEAMAHGLPVVVRHLPGVNDVFVKEAETGFLFDTAEEFKEAIHKLAEDPALRQKIGGAARRLAIEQFGLIPIAKQYFMIYGVSWCAAPADDARSAATIDALDRVAATLPASTSIIDPRFRTAIALPADRRPLLVTTIDAEEDFDWSGPFLRSANDVKSMARQRLAHHVFDRYGVVPTYLVDFPVASQPQGYEPLLDYLRDGKCEIGTQLHPWVNPPFVEDITVPNSFAGNLRLGLEFEKLRVLTETIEEAFGIRPRVYRAGRYGVGRRTGDILKFLGYHVDTSTVPNYGFAREGGPNFFGFPTDPYWINAERTVLELPISSALVGPLVPAPWLTRSIYTATLVRTIFPPLLSRSGLMDRIDLTPEGITGLEAKKLVRALLARGTRVFTLAYHSSSLLPGSTPYVRTAADLDRFLGWLDSFYEFFFSEIGGVAATPTTIYDLFFEPNRRFDLAKSNLLMDMANPGNPGAESSMGRPNG